MPSVRALVRKGQDLKKALGANGAKLEPVELWPENHLAAEVLAEAQAMNTSVIQVLDRRGLSGRHRLSVEKKVLVLAQASAAIDRRKMKEIESKSSSQGK